MRIAIFENLPRGGAKRAALELGRFLAANHKLDLYRLSTTESKAFDLAPLCQKLYTYPFQPLGGRLDDRLVDGKLAPRSYTMFGPLMRVHRQIAADVDHRDYDALLAHTDSYTQAPYVLGYLRQVPSVYFCQEPFRFLEERQHLDVHRAGLRRLPLGRLREAEEVWAVNRMGRLDTRNARAADAIAANSVHSRERIWAAYARTATVCPLGIDVEHFTPASGAVTRRNEVLSIGIPSVIKGHDLVIRALARIPKESRPALRLIMPWRRGSEPFERLAQENGVELTVEAAIDEAEILDRYRRALATVCAARLEAFGFTPLESMACGTPVVAIQEGGYRETVVDGVTGFLVEPDPGAIAAAIATLAGDPSLVSRLGVSGREHVVRSWQWDRGGAALENLLRKVAASREPAMERRAAPTNA